MLTHILVPLNNPHINVYFCYYLDGLFILSLCTEGAAFPYPLQSTPKTCAQKPWKDQRHLRASAAKDVAISQETERRIKISPQEAALEETPQHQHSTGTSSPTAWWHHRVQARDRLSFELKVFPSGALAGKTFAAKRCSFMFPPLRLSRGLCAHSSPSARTVVPVLSSLSDTA